MLNKLRAYMMPVSMLVGALFYTHIEVLSFLTPYLIFLMLFVSYCNISLKEIRFSRLHYWLLLIQLGGSILIYLSISVFQEVVAQGVMMCVLAPTATSAIVITGMLGGNKSSLLAYSLLSNMSVAFVAPVIFVFIGQEDILKISFVDSLLVILTKIMILLLAPFLLSQTVKYLSKRISVFLIKSQSISFYLWNIALAIVTARTVKFILEQDSSHYFLDVVIVLAALIVCVLQFLLGRKVGAFYTDVIAGGQGLGQKNTILAIWMSQTYLDPLSSIGPGSYVLWQNIVNSYQVWKKREL